MSGTDVSTDSLSNGILFPSFSDGAAPPPLFKSHLSLSPVREEGASSGFAKNARYPRYLALPFSFLSLGGRFLLFVLGER